MEQDCTKKELMKTARFIFALKTHGVLEMAMNYQAESKVGLNGRKAICQEWWQQREYDGDDGYEYWEYLNLGVLYVLVIGKK